ncbi:MAG: peptidoglycan DD-metalloendopeptidase family protein [Firmicutes bacterium]|nr:peptidoglycan DD-metalloendopeptidase family protein [Bacillota bacterium]
MKTKTIKDHLKKLVLLTVAVSMVFAFPANSKADTEDELNEVEEQAEEARTERAQMEDELAEKQAVLDDINYEVELLQASIDEKQEEIFDMEARIKEMQHNINEQKGGLGNRLRNMYKSGSIGIFDIILDSENVSELLSNLSLVQKIYNSDQETLMELEKQHDELEKVLAEMQAAKEALDIEMAEMSVIQAEAEAARNEVQAIIDEIQARIDEYEAEAERLNAILEEERAELARQLAAGSGDVYINFSGVSDSGFMWPCSGPLTSYFGYRESPGGIGSTNHGGIDIGVPMYTPIYASRSGYVSGATGWSGGYGYAVYLIHDGGYSTVYGHNSEILVSAGQFVEQGQIIAYAGSTGWSTGPHCHFEIRVNGVQVDPLGYL